MELVEEKKKKYTLLPALHKGHTLWQWDSETKDITPAEIGIFKDEATKTQLSFFEEKPGCLYIPALTEKYVKRKLKRFFEDYNMSANDLK